MSTTIDFAGEKTLPALLKMSLPMMAATFLSMAYNLVDSLWIGNLLGEESMAALTSSTPVILLLNAIAMGTAGGGSILLSQAVGAEDRAAKERLLSTSFFASLGLCLLLTAGSEALLPLLLRGLGTPADILPLARDYLAVYLLGYLSVFLYNYFAAVLRSYGNTAFQAIAMLLCTLLNAVLDPLFIHRLCFSGAAVATVTSQMTALAIMLVYLARKRLFSCHIRQFDRGLLLPLCRSALPSVVQQGVPAVSTAFLTGLVSGYGVSAIAGYGVACKLEVVLLYPAVSLNMALTAIVGQCVGAGRPDRARDYLRASLLFGSGLLAALTAAVLLLARPLAALFLSGEAAVSLAARYLLVVGVGYLGNGLANCFLGAVNGAGRPGTGMLLTALYHLGARIPLAWLASALGFGPTGIWCAVLAGHLVAALSTQMAARRLLWGEGTSSLPAAAKK